MNNTTNRFELNLENPVTVPGYTFAILGAVILFLFITLTCTCCCNEIICCRPWRQVALEDARAEPKIIGATPNSNMVLRSREIVGRRRGTGV
jgi:hypothetical protein